MFTSINNSKKQNYFMRLALLQAKINDGNTNENPSVGCVLVKNNLVLAAGCTSPGGRPHAEVNVINSIKRRKNNLQLYVTLEPCSHYGKTPPCLNIISKRKIKKVFFSIKDSDVRSYNQSKQKLKNKGIKTKSGILSKEINYFYRSYNKSRKSLFPFVTLKIALTKDFYSVNRKKRWITNEFSRGRVHLMRSVHDCVLTSAQTVLKDDPLLTTRIKGLSERSPARIILDRNLITPINSKLVRTAHKIETIIFYNKKNIKKLNNLKKNKVKTFKIKLNSNGKLNLNESLLLAKKLGYNKILVEAGINLSKSFFNQNFIDDLKVFISDVKIYKDGKNNFKNVLNKFIKNKKKLIEKINLLGDSLISYKIK